jgi:uncharacterized protein (UPF0210 family)
MSLDNFLNPEDDDLEDSAAAIEPDIDEIISRHSGYTIEEEVEEGEDEAPAVLIPSIKEALQAVEMLHIFKEHQQTTTRSEMQALD